MNRDPKGKKTEYEDYENIWDKKVVVTIEPEKLDNNNNSN